MTASETAGTVAALVAAARARIENLSVDTAAAELAAGAAILVDIREPDELDRDGRIPGAIHVPRGMLEFCADPTSPFHQPPLDPDQRVILYCASGGRSALAAESLARLGYGGVAHLDGGIAAWREAGHPVV